jgi:hypothetical protein
VLNLDSRNINITSVCCLITVCGCYSAAIVSLVSRYLAELDACDSVDYVRGAYIRNNEDAAVYLKWKKLETDC